MKWALDISNALIGKNVWSFVGEHTVNIEYS